MDILKTDKIASQYEVKFVPRPFGDFPVHRMPHRFDQPFGPIVQLHYHDCLEIGYCYSGVGVFVIEDKVFPFSAGDVVIISKQERHCARSHSDSIMNGIYCWTDPEILLGHMADDSDILNTDRFSGPHFRNVLPGGEFPEISHLVHRIMTEVVERPVGYRSMIRAHFQELMVLLHRLPEKREPVGPYERNPDYERISPALHFMAEHYAESISVDQLARLCHLSERQFRRIFQATVGITVIRYLTNLRIRMAVALLEKTGMPVIQVGQSVGYDALCSFNRNFRQVIGHSPRDYRKQFRKVYEGQIRFHKQSESYRQ